MAVQIHERHVGDTRTVLAVQLKQADENGDLQPVNLTGLTVSFEMHLARDGSTKRSKTSSNVSITDAADGKCQYNFQTDDVDTAGDFVAYFTVTDGGEDDTFPVAQQELKVRIHGD